MRHNGSVAAFTLLADHYGDQQYSKLKGAWKAQSGSSYPRSGDWCAQGLLPTDFETGSLLNMLACYGNGRQNSSSARGRDSPIAESC